MILDPSSVNGLSMALVPTDVIFCFGENPTPPEEIRNIVHLTASQAANTQNITGQADQAGD